MSGRITEQDAETINELAERIQNTINEFSEERRLTVGCAMEALFRVLHEGAKSSGQYNPKTFIAEVESAARAAVGLQ